jgi:hypothetical protein
VWVKSMREKVVLSVGGGWMEDWTDEKVDGEGS